MATTTEQQRLRLDLGFDAFDDTSLPADTINDLFVEAGESYTDDASIAASVRVIALRRLLIQAAADVDYTQNNNSKKASQRYEHLKQELARWQDVLDYVVALSSSSAVRFGRPTRRPARIKEYPTSWGW